ncbi:NADase-type glycan-binding domain-containing protein [Actinokineospora enzanensis]|uniref:NADase-type glycan-binding domain-containing protein n=1 Tax=Actinokineospora enzanensis TaxID=155975 RepID=UPI00035EBAE2|nr:zinc ribbon domain-containing protein [Actinokineospora enzanensis]
MPPKLPLPPTTDEQSPSDGSIDSARPALPSVNDESSARQTAASGLVAGITPGDSQPGAVLPQDSAPARPTVRRQPPTRALKPGDLVCGECGEGNQPTRKFCGRCGNSLAAADVVRTPWWRRLLPRRGAKVRRSGERPRNRRGKSKLGAAFGAVFRVTRRVVSAVLVIAGIAYGISGDFRSWVNAHAIALEQDVEGVVLPQYAPVAPVEITATSELLDHPGASAFDGFSNTFWAAPAAGPEPVLVARFAQPVTLSRAIIRTGARDEFQARHRPHRLHLVFSTGRTADVELKDNPDPQQVDLADGAGVTSVEVHVVSLYQSVKGTDVALTEIEFFTEQ